MYIKRDTGCILAVMKLYKFDTCRCLDNIFWHLVVEVSTGIISEVNFDHNAIRRFHSPQIPRLQFPPQALDKNRARRWPRCRFLLIRNRVPQWRNSEQEVQDRGRWSHKYATRAQRWYCPPTSPSNQSQLGSSTPLFPLLQCYFAR
jgi:hypothetical protein